MELRIPNHGETLIEDLNPENGGEIHSFAGDVDSNCSTPFVSAPSSPSRNPGGYFFSAPASPMHYIVAGFGVPAKSSDLLSSSGSFEFDGANPKESMISADELFFNGQIRPMRLLSHLQRPQKLSPLVDLNEEDEEEVKEGGTSVRRREMKLRSRSVHRRARSLSPMRNSRFQWQDEVERAEKDVEADSGLDLDPKEIETVTQSDSSASSSRSSSSGRNSKRWVFLKDLLYRSKSEGRYKEKEKEKFWHSISFSPSKERSKDSKSKHAVISSTAAPLKKPTNGLAKRRVPLRSAHEQHYTANRAQAEEMRRRTFLPYRQGLFGCLGFSSRSYGAVNGFAKAINPVSSR